MSKAFTKEDGPEVAPVSRRRAPLPDGTPNYVTARGLAALRDELARLDASPLNDAAAAWRGELERRIATALVTAPPEERDVARFGALVRVEDAAGAARAVQIVGVDEADVTHDRMARIAFTAPLARALLGRRAGDVVSVPTPRGEEELTIVGVSYDAATLP